MGMDLYMVDRLSTRKQQRDAEIKEVNRKKGLQAQLAFVQQKKIEDLERDHRHMFNRIQELECKLAEYLCRLEEAGLYNDTCGKFLSDMTKAEKEEYANSNAQL